MAVEKLFFANSISLAKRPMVWLVSHVDIFGWVYMGVSLDNFKVAHYQEHSVVDPARFR